MVSPVFPEAMGNVAKHCSLLYSTNMQMSCSHSLCRPYTVHFVTPEGETIDVKATEGDTMLDLAQRYDIDLECK